MSTATTSPPTPSIPAASASDAALRFHLAVQTDRAIGFTVAALTAILAALGGFTDFTHAYALTLLTLGYATAVLFRYPYRHPQGSPAPRT